MMNKQPRLEVIDRDGWRHEFPLTKAVVHIGTDPRCDVVLDPTRGGGVDPLHAQLITSSIGAAGATETVQRASGRLGCRLVNLGTSGITLGIAENQELPPRAVADLANGGFFKLGDFTLVFHCGEDTSGAFSGGSQHIGLRVSLPQKRLAPNRSLEGVATVSNLGESGGVQIVLELEGLATECYDIEPGPVLFSGAEREVLFHLYHRGTQPPAGTHQIALRAMAPNAYPGEEASAILIVEVLPFHHHTLRLAMPDEARASQPARNQQRVRSFGNGASGNGRESSGR